MNEGISSYNRWILLFLMLFIFVSVNKSPVSHTGSDPKGSLLLSQALIEYQTVKLDKYQGLERYDYSVHEKNGHHYLFFPIGTSISSIPYVWFKTQVLKQDMNDFSDDHLVQKQLAGIVSALIFVVLYLIARLYFDNKISLIIAFVFWLSTSLSSTLGQALWSQNFASLYAFLSIFLMLKIVKGTDRILWLFLGLTLFMAYITRPTMALLSIAVILYLFVNNRKYIAIKTATLVACLLGGLSLFSMNEFNQFLPDYYLPKGLSNTMFWTALWGNLFGPARGLFIFTPLLLLFVLNIKYFYISVKENKSQLILISWIVLHLIIVSKFYNWWAGHSYGPRFMIDVLPAVYVLFLHLLSTVSLNSRFFNKWLVIAFLIITIPASIYFNAVQGLYNQYSGTYWNGEPNIDQHSEYLFDWKYPQFLHTKERHELRLAELDLKNIEAISLPHSFELDTNKAIFIGWSHREKNHRWSSGHGAKIMFKLLGFQGEKGSLILNASTLGEQKIKLSINGLSIGSKTVDTIVMGEYLTFKFNKDILNRDEINSLEFEFSNAHIPNSADPRVLAMSLKSFSLE